MAGLRPLACWDCGFESHRGAWMLACCECCLMSGRGLCDELITRPEESYRLWRVVVCDLETSWVRRPWPAGGGGAVALKKNGNWKYGSVNYQILHTTIRNGSYARGSPKGCLWPICRSQVRLCSVVKHRLQTNFHKLHATQAGFSCIRSTYQYCRRCLLSERV